MITKELFEGPVGDYRIARNTIKCLLQKPFSKRIFLYLFKYIFLSCKNSGKGTFFSRRLFCLSLKMLYVCLS